MSPLLVQLTFIFAYAILAEAALSFLGVGVPPRRPDLGHMIAEGQHYAAPGAVDRAVPRHRHHRSPRCRCNCWATGCATCSTRACGSSMAEHRCSVAAFSHVLS
jgi:hypothetical protein